MDETLNEKPRAGHAKKRASQGNHQIREEISDNRQIIAIANGDRPATNRRKMSKSINAIHVGK